MKRLFAIISLFFLSQIYGQGMQMHSDVAYLYKIDQDQFKYYNSNYLSQQLSAITSNNPIDTIPYADINYLQYSFQQIGAFLLVYVDHTLIHHQLIVNFPWRAKTVFYPFKGGIMVLDSLNKPISGLDIRADNDRIYYNSKSGVYVYEDPGMKGNIYISNGKMTEELKLDIPYNRGYGGGKSRYRKKQYRGFVVTNKPVYKPGDTLKLKAYVCRTNGEPYNEPIQLSMSEYYYTPLYTVQLNPVSPGAYVHEFVIGDSLKIDKDYYLNIACEDNLWQWKDIGLQNSFRLEDYKLDEAEYSLTPLHYSNYLEDSLYLQFEAFDKNHNQMFDAEVDILCKAYNISDIKIPAIYFPDTLFMETFRLADLNGGIIQLPSYLKHKYPANYTLSVEANFRNSNNELKNTTAYIEILNEETPFQYYISNYYLKFSKNSTIKDSITVKKYTGFKEHTEGYRLYKNDSLKIDRDATAYSVEYNGDIRTFQVSSSMFNVKMEGEIHVDTLLISIINPTKIPLIAYYLKGETKISLLDTSFQTLIIHKNKSVKIYCEYFTGGNKVILGESFILNNKNIWIKHNLPDKVYPGESLDLNFSTYDYKNRSLGSTNLTVLSINAAFENNNIPNVPVFGKSADYTNTSPAGNLDKKTFSSVTRDIDNEWVNKFNLQSNAYYQILLSAQKIVVYREPNIYSHDDLVKIIGLDKDMNFSDPAYVMENDTVVYYNYSETDHIKTKNGKHSYKVRFNKFNYTTPEINTYNDSITYIVVKTDLLELGTEKQKIKMKSKAENFKIGEQFIAFEPYRYTNNPYFFYNSKESYCIKSEYYYYGTVKIIGPFKSNVSDGIYVQQYRYNNAEYLLNNLERHCLNLLDDDKHMVKKDFGSYKFAVATKYIYEPFALKNPTYLYQNFEEWKNTHYDKLVYFQDSYKGSKFLHDKVNILFPETDLGIAGTILKNLTKDSTWFLKGRQSFFYDLTPGAYRVVYVDKEMQPLVEDVFVVKPNTFLVKEIDTAGVFFTDTLKSTLGESHWLNGRVIDEKTGNALMFASITIEQNGKAVGGFTSDLNGYFSLEIPHTNGTESIKINCVGYVERKIGYATFFDDNSLAEFELTPLADDKLFMGSIPSKYGDDMERVVKKGHYHRYRAKFRTTEVPNFGSTEVLVNFTSQRLYTTDVYNWDFNGSSNDATIFIDGVKEREENDLMTVNGDGIYDFDEITEKSTTGWNYVDPEIILNANAIRTFFADNAIWQPNLVTNENGSVSYKVRFPENITSWSTYILAIHPRGLSAQITTNTKSYKPLIASVRLPDFVIEGDSFEIVNKVMNHTGISLGTKNRLMMGEVNLQQIDTTFKDFFVYKKILFADPGDSIKVSFSTSLSNGYLDGEKRVIPIYKKGIDVYKGKMFPAWKNTTINIDSLDKGKEVEIEIYNGFEELLVKEADYLLFHYLHACNEQISSKLITAICASATTTKQWKKEIYDLQIENMIQLLRKNQNDNGGWSWWGKGKTNVFMTLKVAEALKLAEEKGYEVKLRNSIAEAVPQLLKDAFTRDDTLAVMKVAGLYKVPKENVFDLKTIYLLSIIKTDYQKLLVMEINQLYGNKIDITELMSMKKETLFGNYYWGTNSYYLNDNATYMTSMALEILNHEKTGQDTLIKLIGYMLEKRINGHFSNTMVSAKMSLFFHDHFSELSKTDPVIIIDKKDTVQIKNAYHKMIVSSNVISIDILTDRLIYVGYAQQKKLPYEAVREEYFSIKHEWLQDNKPVVEINAGKFVTLHTTVEVKKDAQYMSFEIPIPAGCTYANKINDQKYYSYEVHREYFKDRIVVYYENLPIGKYELNFQLEPRFKGTYSVNNSLMENMYFPQLNGYNALYQLKIK